jgi:hypothetical protein
MNKRDWSKITAKEISERHGISLEDAQLIIDNEIEIVGIVFVGETPILRDHIWTVSVYTNKGNGGISVDTGRNLGEDGEPIKPKVCDLFPSLYSLIDIISKKTYWISWSHDDREAFDLPYPYWITGEGGYGGLNFQTICASIKAVSEEIAKEIVKKSYKIKLPHKEYEMKINWILCEEHEYDWIPNESRFPYSKIGTFIKEKK